MKESDACSYFVGRLHQVRVLNPHLDTVQVIVQRRPRRLCRTLSSSSCPSRMSIASLEINVLSPRSVGKLQSDKLVNKPCRSLS